MKENNESVSMQELENGKVNLGFEADEGLKIGVIDNKNLTEKPVVDIENQPEPERMQWGNGLEFLMSCIAMSVGLGNIWRFPFTAFENGGGAFLIPYSIILAVVGRPLYYLEMAVGQFTSKGCVKIWEAVPLLKGVGYGQLLASISILTYYCALMAITLYYLFVSFSSELPWAKCNPEWDLCFDSAGGNTSFQNMTGLRSSSEIYFLKEVLHEKSQIDDGIGLPDWRLTICLGISWLLMFLVLMKGIQSSGKASYFLALFPYVILIGLLIRACTLPGAINGISFFVTPQWAELLNPKVWYAAVTQAFFSLGVCFGAITTYSSYNNFRHNIHRDAMIVTLLDTVTSMIAGVTIFGILGNLAHESGTTDISSVTKGGTGLAFISYPEAIAKFEFVPQLFSILFFLMFYILGIGSAVSCHGAVITIFTDQFSCKYWKVALITSILGFLSGLIYLTPGGQYMLNLVDYFAGSFSIFVLASVEAIGICWIYGLDNFCMDVEFMLNIKIGPYWRICWGLFTPVLLLVILIYFIAIAQPLTYGTYIYPDIAYVCGWLLMAFGIAQIPIWGIYAICKYRGESLTQVLKKLLSPSDLWGPADPTTRKEWEQYKRKRLEEVSITETPLQRLKRLFFSSNQTLPQY